MQGKIAERTAQDFVREVQRKVERFNQRETCLQVLVGGRELVVQANETDFRKDGQILHVLPYFVPEHDWENYVDAKKLLKQDQRQLWWQNYGAVSGHGYTGLPTELDQGNLTEITAQPLLNYLVALSLKRGELEFSEETNLNAVYADLLTAIYERGWAEHQHAAIQGIDEKDFVRILEEIALAAWHGNGRTTTVREIERHCESSNLKKLLSRFQEGFQDDSKASITRLLTAFYFRQSGHDQAGDKTFEFTHKSFGEYLTARRIVQEVQYIHRKLEDRYSDPYEDWDERRALHRWALVCGPSAMDEYLFDFVLNEVRLHHQQNKADVAKWQQTLCHLIGFMLRYGMPMERLNPRPDFHKENQQAVNAEEALLAVLNACAKSTRNISNITWTSNEALGAWILRLQGPRPADVAAPVVKYLSLMNLQRCNLFYKDLFGANFEGSDLKGANLAMAHLEGASFEGANLEGASFEGANLEEASFEGANLEEAHLEEVYLGRTNLKGTILEGKIPSTGAAEPE